MNGAAPAVLRTLPFAGLKLDAPIRDCPKLFALAGNYGRHIAEGGIDQISAVEGLTPQFFWKPNTCINAPGGEITIRENNVFVDWEIELGVVIGKRAKDVSAADAMSCVFGYTIINDVSERKYNSTLENRKVRAFDPFFDWLMGKWFDGHAPMGPEIVTADEVADPHDLALRLYVNDELMQDGRTSEMLFRIPETIAHLSSVVTLEPGDVIATGTTAGTGSARGIKLKSGDRMRGEIEGLGALETVIK